MNNKLSIIIPCYNCQDTLEEAVASAYRQKLAIPFELILVNDASTDNTQKVIEQLAQKCPNLYYHQNEKNQGGGSTRNTAVEKSTGDIIFCLDSDDILGDRTLNKMVNFLLEKNSDAVGVSTSIKFNGKDLKDIAFVNNFDYIGEKIPFESLFSSQKCSLYSVFMFTKRAFEITGGYPTEHGFDTQSFAWRFLANGLVAYTCPETIYYHRVNFHHSYYIREYESGKANHNWFKIFEEFLYLFKIDVRQNILTADLNNPGQSLPNLTNDPASFRPDYLSLVLPRAKEHYENLIKIGQESDPTDYYWLGAKKMSEGKTSEARAYLAKAFKKGSRSAHLYQKLLAVRYPFNSEEKEKAKFEITQLLSYKKNGSALFLPIRVYRKIKRILFPQIKKYWSIIKGHWDSSPNKKLFVHWLILRLRKFLKNDFVADCSRSDKTTIDVVIPTVSKDQILLETVLNSLTQICQPINKIYIVAPVDDFVINFCQEHHCHFIDERTILGYGKEIIDYKVDRLDRSGWLFQQLLKLSGEKFVEAKNYFVLDSDTVLLNPHSLVENEKFVFYENEEWNAPYFKNFEKIFGYPTRNRLSFTSHMMIFNTDYLKEMKLELEKKHGQSWDLVYRSTIDRQENSCISDYDTYANWVLINHPEKMLKKPLYNRSLKREQPEDLEKLKSSLSQKYNSISFHSYYLKNRAEIIKEFDK